MVPVLIWDHPEEELEKWLAIVMSTSAESRLPFCRRNALLRVATLLNPFLSFSVSPKDFSVFQRACPTLTSLRNNAAKNQTDVTRKGSISTYEVYWILYRLCLLSKDIEHIFDKKYLVVPAECHRRVLTPRPRESFGWSLFSQQRTILSARNVGLYPQLLPVLWQVSAHVR